jgi:HSP20 family protein
LEDVERAYRADTSVKEDEKFYRVTFELPGIDKKDVSVELVEGTLVVSAERKKEDVKEGECEHHDDFIYGKRVNRVSFPKEVDAGKIDATFKNGLLTIVVPKKEEVKPKPISIKVK